jgi:hypothetical protein
MVQQKEMIKPQHLVEVHLNWVNLPLSVTPIGSAMKISGHLTTSRIVSQI